MLVVVASGCAGLSNSDTPERESFDSEGDIPENLTFQEMAAKAENSDYHVEFTLEGKGPLMYDGRPEIFSYDGIRKVSRYGTLGNYEVYYKDKFKIDCVELNGDTGCSQLPTDVAPSVDYYDHRIDRFNVTHLGEREIIGRGCQMFELRGKDFFNSKLNICLDNRKGFASLIRMETTDNSTRTVMEMKATSYDMRVSEEDVELPVKALPDLDCDEGILNITTTSHSGEVKFNVDGDSNRTIEMNPWTVESVNVSESISGGENTATVHAGDTSEEISCQKYY